VADTLTSTSRASSRSREDRSPEARDDDFSFGTTKPLQLPVVVAPKVANEPQSQPPDEILNQTLLEYLHQSQHQAQSQTLFEESLPSAQQQAQTITVESDDEFTFGTTNPLALPDANHISPLHDQTEVNQTVVCAPTLSSQMEVSPTVVCVPSNGQESYATAGRDYIMHEYDSGAEVIESRPFPPQQEIYRRPSTPQQPFGYSSPVVSSIDPGYWSYPSPMVSFPMTLPYCAVSPMYLDDQDSMLVCGGDVSAIAHPDAAEIQDLERDPETGVDSEPCSIQPLKTLSSSFGDSSKTRRWVAASFICLLLVCMAVVIAILVIF
jgi:hypothetical protein